MEAFQHNLNSKIEDRNDPNKNSKKNNKLSPLVVVKKTINAPAEKIFSAWSNEELVKVWWGPQGFNCPSAQVDFREGGKYLFAMRNDTDQAKKIIWSTGTFQEIHPYRKIVCSDYFANDKGEIVSAKEAGGPDGFEGVGDCTITIELETLEDDETQLILSHEGIPASMHDDCVNGWSSSLDKLKHLVENHNPYHHKTGATNE